MARIAGVDLPNDKRIEIALTYIYGIGRTSADEIIAQTGINPDTRVKDLTEDEVAKIRDQIENNYKVEGDLKREVQSNIKRTGIHWTGSIREISLRDLRMLTFRRITISTTILHWDLS